MTAEAVTVRGVEDRQYKKTMVGGTGVMEKKVGRGGGQYIPANYSAPQLNSSSVDGCTPPQAKPTTTITSAMPTMALYLSKCVEIRTYILCKKSEYVSNDATTYVIQGGIAEYTINIQK